MNNWKAVTAGVLTTIILVLMSQLIFILAAAYIGGAKGDLAFLAQHKETLWLVLALLSFCISMTMGGVATALFSQTNRIRNALIVGAVVSCLSLFASLGSDRLTPSSALLVILGVTFAALGAAAWQRWIR